MGCKDSRVQKYDCGEVYRPDWNREETVCVDRCLVPEIFELWDKGIITTGCCCGKHINSPENSSFIGVLPKFISEMKQLGYKVKFNECRPNDEDSFIPKTMMPIEKTFRSKKN